MEQEKLDEALERLKMLLGINESEQDSLLSFLIEDTVDMILGYCRIEVLPRQLESLIPMIAADMYRAKGYGQIGAPEVVKSISEGERSVSYAETNPNGNFLSSYYDRLRPFIRRKGRVPSDVRQSI